MYRLPKSSKSTNKGSSSWVRAERHHTGRSAGGTTRVHEDVFDRSIDVRILRRRLERGPSARAPRVIQTERGIGYVFADPVERV